MFKFKKKTKLYLKDISIQHIATGQLGAYILQTLYEREGFSVVGYETYKNVTGELRCKFHTLPNTKSRIVSYFNDRCAGFIEYQIEQLEGVEHSWEKLNEVEYVVKHKTK